MDTMQSTYVRRIEDHAVWTKLDEGVMIISTVDNQEKVLKLNKTAACLWEQADGTQTIGELIEHVCRTFDVDHQTARTDAAAFIEDMQRRQLIAVSSVAA